MSWISDPGQLTLLIIAFAAAAFFGVRYWRRRQRRERLLARPLSLASQDVIARHFPIYRKLPDELRARHEGLINRFLDEIKFYGQEGFEITREVKLLIAAQACILLVGKPERWFPTLQTIFIYPAAFKSKIRSSDHFLASEQEVINAGESWLRGPVVLAWDHSLRGAVDGEDGHNVVIHEFAHQLDKTTGTSDGSPLLDKDQSASQWAQVFQYAYEHLRRDAKHGKPSVFDYYGAHSPAEFFAVAVETFFEKPRELRDAEPAVYEELKTYFGIDPVLL